jgi:hypothetical protein
VRPNIWSGGQSLIVPFNREEDRKNIKQKKEKEKFTQYSEN